MLLKWLYSTHFSGSAWGINILVFDVPWAHSGAQLTCNEAKSKPYEILLCP